jgi:hypothetical protein
MILRAVFLGSLEKTAISPGSIQGHLVLVRAVDRKHQRSDKAF